MQGISWTEFFSYLAGCLSGYYITLVWVYCRGSIRRQLKTWFLKPIADEPSSAIHADDQFASAHQCANRLRALFDQAPNEADEQALQASIKLVLADYQWLKGTPFQYALNNLLTYGWEQRYDRPLDEPELEGCWMG